MDLLFHEYDNCLSKNVTADNLFGILDASSLLWRLEVTGVEVGEERWSKITNAIAEHTHVHRSPWLVIVSLYNKILLSADNNVLHKY